MLTPIRVEITTPPTSEPITLEQAKEHCQVEGDEYDDVLNAYIAAARAAVESLTGMQMLTATYQVGFAKFPRGNLGRLHLPRRPATAVTSVTYYDTNNTQQTLSTSLWDLVTATPRSYLIPAWQQTWPEVRDQPGAENVTVTFTAGYSAAASVPKEIINATKMLIRDLYDNPGAQQDPAMVLQANPNYKMLLGLYTMHNL